MAELVRVTRPGGRVLVIDQIAPVDPFAASELNTFERARDPSTSRVLAEVDLRGLFESNGLVLLRSEQEREPRDLDAYLELAGCEGDERASARSRSRPGATRPSSAGTCSSGANREPRALRRASGKRPVSAFEKTSRPSAITSYCPFPPGIASASKPSALSSVARLAALSS